MLQASQSPGICKPFTRNDHLSGIKTAKESQSNNTMQFAVYSLGSQIFATLRGETTEIVCLFVLCKGTLVHTLKRMSTFPLITSKPTRLHSKFFKWCPTAFIGCHIFTEMHQWTFVSCCLIIVLHESLIADAICGCTPYWKLQSTSNWHGRHLILRRCQSMNGHRSMPRIHTCRQDPSTSSSTEVTGVEYHSRQHDGLTLSLGLQNQNDRHRISNVPADWTIWSGRCILLPSIQVPHEYILINRYQNFNTSAMDFSETLRATLDGINCFCRQSGRTICSKPNKTGSIAYSSKSSDVRIASVIQLALANGITWCQSRLRHLMTWREVSVLASHQSNARC